MKPRTKRPGRALRGSLRGAGALLLCVALLAACRGGPIEHERIVATGGDQDRGRTYIETMGCGSCHTVPGIRTARGRVAPPLDFFAERAFVAGAVPNTPENLIRWIMDPQAIEPGTAMPDLDVPEPVARDIAAYLYSLE